MAALVKPSALLNDGTALRLSVYRIVGASSGDTVDVSADFKRVAAAAFIGASANVAVQSVTATTAGVVTISSSGITNDDGWLFVVGGGPS